MSFLFQTKFTLLIAFSFLSCKGNVNPPVKTAAVKEALANLPLERLKLPPGFKIEVYAENIANARSMSYAEEGLLFVGSRSGGKVHVLVDEDQDFKSDETHVLMEGGNMPNGVAYRNGDLYVAEVNRVLKYPNIAESYSERPNFEIINDDYPTDGIMDGNSSHLDLTDAYTFP